MNPQASHLETGIGTGIGTTSKRLQHDLRNVLYLVSSFAQLLREASSGPVTPQQLELLTHIVDCAARGQQLLAPASAEVSGDSRDA